MRVRPLVFVSLALAAAAALAWWALGRPGDEAGTGMGRNAASGPEDGVPGGVVPAAGSKAAGDGKSGRVGRSVGAGIVIGSLWSRDGAKSLAGRNVTITVGDAAAAGSVRRLDPVVTGPDGEFRFDDVPARTDWIVRVPPGPDADAVELPCVAVRHGKVTDLGRIVAGSPGSCSGVVVDSAGQPARGAVVSVHRPIQFFNGTSLLKMAASVLEEPPSIASATADAEGKFKIERLSPGNYDLAAVSGLEGLQGRASARAQIRAGSASDVRLVLSAGHDLRGRVVRKTGTPAGPVAGVTVRVQPEFAMPWDAGKSTAKSVTEADGSFRVRGVSAGRWKLSAAPENELPTSTSIEIPAAEDVVIELGGDASLEGRVVGHDNAPVAGAQIVVTQSQSVLNQRVLMLVSDATGKFQVGGLSSPGPVKVFVEAKGFVSWGAMSDAPDELFGRAKGDRTGTVDLVPGVNPLDVQMSRGGTLRGKIVQKGAATPIGGAMVRVRGGGLLAMFAASETLAAADGTFELTGLAPGEGVADVTKTGWELVGGSRSSLAAMLSGYAGSSAAGGSDSAKPAAADTGTGVKLVVAEGSVIERVFELDRMAVVTGRVVSPRGEPVTGAAVRVVASGGMQAGIEAMMGNAFSGIFGGGEAPAFTDTQGVFEVPVSTTGKSKVEASARGFVTNASKAFGAKSGERVEGVEVKLKAGGTIEGKVMLPDGTPAADAKVSWSGGNPLAAMFGGGAAGGENGEVWTGADGRFRLQGLSSGVGALSVERAGFVRFTKQKVAVREGSVQTVDAALELGRVLEGNVTDASGNPVAGAQVAVKEVNSSDNGFDFASIMAAASGSQAGASGPRTDGSGRFRFDGLAPGKFRISAKAAGFIQTVTAEVESGASGVAVRMTKLIPIRGVVRYGGQPARGATVWVKSGSPAASSEDASHEAPAEYDDSDQTGTTGSTVTDGAGAFELRDLRPGFRFTIGVRPVASGAGADARSKFVDDVDAGASGVQIDLESGVSITGRVGLPAGAKIENCNVTCSLLGTDGADPDQIPPAGSSFDFGSFGARREPQLDGQRSTVVSTDGTFAFHGREQGRAYRITVSTTSGMRGRAVTEGGREGVLVAVVPMGSISGRFVTAAGEAVRAASVSLTDSEGEAHSTWAFRKLEVADLPPGSATLTAEGTHAGRKWSGTFDVVVRPGEKTDLGDLRLSDAGPAAQTPGSGLPIPGLGDD